MSTPTPEDPRQDPDAVSGDGVPPVPGPPQYGQRLPDGGAGASGSPQYGQNAPGQYGQGQYGPGQYGQPGPGLPPGYGQPGQPNLPPPGQGYSTPAPSAYGYGYGQQPAGGAPGFAGPAGTRPTPPKQLNIAFWLIMAAGILTLVQALVLIFVPSSVFMQAFNEAMSAQDPEMQRQFKDAGIDIQSMVAPMKIVATILMVVTAGVYALIASFIRKGSNGARITGTVFAAISLIGLVAPSDPLTLIITVLGIAGIVFAWLTPSSQYVKAMTQRKRGGFR
ncbi:MULTISPECIES: hypothetical protein [Micrococcaceae]|uniref:Uncharacterized protein n=1 Tax=Arthrobacter rhombi TaxID=71253 RepID=A0A1R4G5K6_9MICC|nr:MULTISPECIES: hypothetical protein [Micrococcaceae]PCC26021.1 hypothetical protein CIK75_06065 [Glutamicibacter sp. BW78]SJM63365.1 hypothetical protein FM101_07855 [Arthrobacter rhombi]